jgi:tetraacyldisaccharide 4'-kinase
LPGREPDWWYRPAASWQAVLLSPVSYVVGRIAAARIAKANTYKSRLPVICVGNFTVGGSGKTPLALFIARLVAGEGREPWFLSRGYGGRLEGPVRVDASKHAASDVGDEPLLLARRAPTVIARNRAAGARWIETAAPSNAVIIMDDGLQNPSLAKDVALAVIDRGRGFGNGLVIPAGPLRAPIAAQASLPDLIVLTGRETPQTRAFEDEMRRRIDSPVIKASARPVASERFRSRRVLAYAGIANPQRFFTMLESLGAIVIERRAFADHHAFSDREARDLLDRAQRLGADLVTTEKDLARLSAGSGPRAELRDRSVALRITVAVEGDDLATLKAVIGRALSR